MKRIYYAGTSMVTGDRLAAALLGYAQALASNRSSTSIEMPVLLADGSPGIALVVLGPASEIVAMPAPAGDAVVGEIVDDALEARLLMLTRELGSPSPRESGSEPVAPIPLDELL